MALSLMVAVCALALASATSSFRILAGTAGECYGTAAKELYASCKTAALFNVNKTRSCDVEIEETFYVNMWNCLRHKECFAEEGYEAMPSCSEHYEKIRQTYSGNVLKCPNQDFTCDNTLTIVIAVSVAVSVLMLMVAFLCVRRSLKSSGNKDDGSVANSSQK